MSNVFPQNSMQDQPSNKKMETLRNKVELIKIYKALTMSRIIRTRFRAIRTFLTLLWIIHITPRETFTIFNIKMIRKNLQIIFITMRWTMRMWIIKILSIKPILNFTKIFKSLSRNKAKMVLSKTKIPKFLRFSNQ